MKRTHVAGAFGAFLALANQLACGGAVMGDQTGAPDAIRPPPAREAGTPEPAGPGVDAAPPVLPVEDSRTLRVTILVLVDPTGAASTSKEDVGAEIFVDVFEAETDAPVFDAQVVGGPAGRLVPLTLEAPDPYRAGRSYTGTFAGYDRSWGISVVRGADVLKNVVLTGPSYPALSFVAASNGANVSWWPAHEADVTTQACAEQVIPQSQDPRGALRWCSQQDAAHDEGSAVLTASEENLNRTATFPASGATYEVTLEESQVNIPVGSRGGAGEFRIFVRTPAPVR